MPETQLQSTGAGTSPTPTLLPSYRSATRRSDSELRAAVRSLPDDDDDSTMSPSDFARVVGALHLSPSEIRERRELIQIMLSDPTVRYQDVADIFGITRQRVNQLANAVGVKHRGRSRADRKPIASIAEIKALAKEVTSLEELRLKLDYGKNRVERVRQALIDDGSYDEILAMWRDRRAARRDAGQFEKARALAETLGRMPTASEIVEAHISMPWVIERHGSLTGLAEALGYPPRKQGEKIDTYSPNRATADAQRFNTKTARLVEDYHALALKLGHTPSSVELIEAGIWPVTLIARFGSLTDAARALGYAPNVARGTEPLPDSLKGVARKHQQRLNEAGRIASALIAERRAKSDKDEKASAPRKRRKRRRTAVRRDLPLTALEA